jgi:hypothetical protein
MTRGAGFRTLSHALRSSPIRHSRESLMIGQIPLFDREVFRRNLPPPRGGLGRGAVRTIPWSPCAAPPSHPPPCGGGVSSPLLLLRPDVTNHEAKAGIHERSRARRSLRSFCLDARFRGDDEGGALALTFERIQGHRLSPLPDRIVRGGTPAAPPARCGARRSARPRRPPHAPRS